MIKRPLNRDDLPRRHLGAQSMHIPVILKCNCKKNCRGKIRFICDIHFHDDTVVYLENAQGVPTKISELELIVKM